MLGFKEPRDLILKRLSMTKVNLLLAMCSWFVKPVRIWHPHQPYEAQVSSILVAPCVPGGPAVVIRYFEIRHRSQNGLVMWSFGHHGLQLPEWRTGSTTPQVQVPKTMVLIPFRCLSELSRRIWPQVPNFSPPVGTSSPVQRTWSGSRDCHRASV